MLRNLVIQPLKRNHRSRSIIKCVLKNFAEFTGKHLRHSLFFNNNAAGLSLQLYDKRDPGTGVFL